MKALTLHPEWLPLILEAATDARYKNCENRPITSDTEEAT